MLNPLMGKLRALFLDIDDTLYSTSEFAAAARRAALDAMIRHGLRISLDDAVAELAEVIAEFGSNSRTTTTACCAACHPRSCRRATRRSSSPPPSARTTTRSTGASSRSATSPTCSRDSRRRRT
jgi:hypothetical protein